MTDEVWSAYRAWRDAPFPPGGASSPILDELHKDLILADVWVAQTVLPFVTKGIHEPAVPDVLGELERIRRRVQEIADKSRGGDRVLAMKYDKYADHLQAAYQWFLGAAP